MERLQAARQAEGQTPQPGASAASQQLWTTLQTCCAANLLCAAWLRGSECCMCIQVGEESNKPTLLAR